MELRFSVIRNEFTVPVVPVRLLTSFLDFKVIDELIHWSPIQLRTCIVKISTASLERCIIDLLIRVHIVILPMLDQAVAILGFEAYVGVDEDWVIHSDEAVALLFQVLFIASPRTWRLPLRQIVLMIQLFMLLTDHALREETTASSEAETVGVELIG